MKPETMTTEDALELLKISRPTFFSRVKEKRIRPANYNPALKKQHRPVWNRKDIEQLAVVDKTADDEEKPAA